MKARSQLRDDPARPTPRLAPGTAHVGTLSLLDEPLTALFLLPALPRRPRPQDIRSRPGHA